MQKYSSYTATSPPRESRQDAGRRGTLNRQPATDYRRARQLRERKPKSISRDGPHLFPRFERPFSLPARRRRPGCTESYKCLTVITPFIPASPYFTSPPSSSIYRNTRISNGVATSAQRLQRQTSKRTFFLNSAAPHPRSDEKPKGFVHHRRNTGEISQPTHTRKRSRKTRVDQSALRV